MAQTRSNLQLLHLQINTLYESNAAGRLLCVNEPGPEGTRPPAPRFFMGRTTTGNLWRYRHDLPDAVIAQLEPLCRAEPLADNLADLPQNYGAIKAVLQAHAPIQNEYRGPNYWLPLDPPVPNHIVLISAANRHLVERHFAWVIKEEPYIYGPVTAAIVQKQAVSLCFCSRIPGEATEAGLETVVDYRRQGHAVAVVAAWAAAVRQTGCLPLYSTGWANLASQAVARKVGAVGYGEDWSLD
jgi:RimJ/RimL family protein N-acetyltransferase